MNNINAFNKLTCLALVAFGLVAVTGCAGGGDDESTPNDEAAQGDTASTEDELGSAGGCKSRAQYLAHANRVCGPSNHVIEYDKGETRYRRGGEWRHCAPNFYVSVPWHCK